MFYFNKKGSALMQVMVLGSVIAAIIVMLMRFAVGRTGNMLKTKRVIQAKAYAEGCIAQYNTMAMERALEGFPVPVNSDGKELFTCTIDGKNAASVNGSNQIEVDYASTVTGVGIIKFDVVTRNFDETITP